MPGVLEYALSLKTAGFDNPLRESEGNLESLDGSARKATASLDQLASAASNAGSNLKGAATQVESLAGASDAASQKLDQVVNLQRAQIAQTLANAIGEIGNRVRETASKFEGSSPEITANLDKVATALDATSAAVNGAAIGFTAAGPAGAAFGATIFAGVSLAKNALTDMVSAFSNADAAFQRSLVYQQKLQDLRASLAKEEVEAQAAAIAAQLEAHNNYQEKLNSDAVKHGDFMRAEAKRIAENQAKLEAERVANASKANDAIRASQEKVFAARLTEEQNLQRQIDALRKSGPTTAAEVNKLPANSDAQKAAAESLAELVTLEKQLADLKDRNAATDAAKAATAAKQIADAAKELSARAEASALFNADNEILQARIAGNDKLVKQLERQQEIEKLKLDLMRDQGLSESEAATKAAQRIALEEKANGVRRRGILDAAASAAAKLDRRGEADPTKRQGNTDRLAQADLERRRNRPLSPARAAEQLARGNAAADPGRARREERAAAEKKGSDPLLRVVKDIADKFSNLAVS